MHKVKQNHSFPIHRFLYESCKVEAGGQDMIMKSAFTFIKALASVFEII